MCAPSPRELARKLDTLYPTSAREHDRTRTGVVPWPAQRPVIPLGPRLRALRHSLPVGAASLQEC